MATYVNDLRLKEIATGDESGTWGTSTNTNLELIAEAFSFGTEAITTNADTHTTTIADGSTDPGRSLYLKYTGTLDSACTITIGPNTVSKLWFIENGTSGSQNIIISQGSGANVTIPAGHVKAVYSDGAGSGAAIVDAFTDLNVAGDFFVGDDLTLLSDAAVLGFGADTDTTLTHVADTGILLNSTRQLQFGDSGTYIHQSADGVLDLVSDTELELNATTIDMNGNLDLSGTINNIAIKADITDFANSILIGNDAATGTLDAATNNTGLGHNVFESITSADDNTAVGSQAMKANTTGAENTAVGKSALAANTTGSNNTAVGKDAMLVNTTGSDNSAFGIVSLDANTTGDKNTAIGYGALSANTTADNNTAVGYGSLLVNTTGYDNVAVGRNSLDANTTGYANTAIGESCLTSNTTANGNTAVGQNALAINTTGASNVAVGRNALDANTTANSNVAVGESCMGANTTGARNTAMGSESLQSNTTGQYNVSIGFQALKNSNKDANVAVGYEAMELSTGADSCVAVGTESLKNATGDDNTAVGRYALNTLTSGANNVAVGYSAAKSQTTASQNTIVGALALDANTTGDNITAIGYDALGANTTGTNNTACGSKSSNQITTGGNNTAIGFDSLTRCTTGGNNACVGKDAGDNITTGSGNVCVGHDAGTNITQGDNNISIGNASETSGEAAANCITLGHDLACVGSNSFSFGKSGNVVSNDFDANASFSRASDLHKKTNIEDTDLGLSFINELRPVTFNWKPNTEFPKHFKDYSETENHMDTEVNMYGMIAQDVEKALDKVGHKNFGGWSKEEDGSQRLSQSMFIYPLINAVKELSAQVKELKAKLNEGE